MAVVMAVLAVMLASAIIVRIMLEHAAVGYQDGGTFHYGVQR